MICISTIRTAIELQDNFTNVLYQVINSVNLGLSAMENLHETMNSPVDTASMEAARDSINQATIAVQQLDAAMQGIETPEIQTSTTSQSSVPVMLPVQAPVEWQSYEGPDVFTNTGVERFEQEVASVNSMMERLSETQAHITQQANTSEILSPQASDDIQSVENRIQELVGMINQAENNPLNVGTEEANAQLERLRMQLDHTLQLQNNLDAAMQGMDISEINTAYLRLSQNVTGMERFVRDSFSNIPPVEVPVHWQSDSLEVFTNSGVERFEQEVQSANNMLNTLNQTQERIVQTAADMDFLPPGGFTDLSNIQNRLQAIQQRIQMIESNPLNMGTDTANSELEQLRRQLDRAVQEQETLNRAVENMDVEAANQAYLRLSQTVGSTERYIRDNTDEQGRFNRAIEDGAEQSNNLMGMIKSAVAAYATIQTVQKALDLSDQFTSTTARLNLMNDELQTTQELQNMIFASAERSRGSYQATADAVSKLGLMAGDAFSSSEEIIAFMEQVNKQFTIAGTGAAGIDAAMLQLTQAMGSGVLRGEEYNSVLEQAPNIIQAIADYLDVPKGKLKDMAADGVITADIVKAAVFAAADETNAKFESMPLTFHQIWTSFQNNALMAFQPVLQRMSEIANNQAFQTFVNGAVEGFAMVAGVTLEVFNLLVSVAGAVADNWSWLAPIIYGVAAAMVVYYTALGIYNTIQAIGNGIKVVAAFAEKVYTASLRMEAGATFMATAAQYGFNAALLACPITWIIILIIALIAIFYAAVAAVNHFAGTSVSATGIICGAFMVALAYIGNIVVALHNLVVDVIVLIHNRIAEVANFIGNVFIDPVGAVCRLFFGMADTVLGILQALASAIDIIFGSNLAGNVQGWRDSLSGWVDETFGKGVEIMAKINADDRKLKRFEYGEAWNLGYSFGEGIDKKLADFMKITVPEQQDYSNLISGIADDIGVIKDSVNISSEDLKYLRDIAERDYINKFTTAKISVKMNNNNTINKDMDLDGLSKGLRMRLEEEMSAAAEMAHV